MKKIWILSSVVIALGFAACNNASQPAQEKETETTEVAETTTTSPDEMNGKELFYSRCFVCHLDKRPESKERAKHMLAPPMVAVMFHVKDTIKGTTEEETRQKVIDFIIDYAQNPDREKSICRPMAIKRFGLMPSIKASTTEEELIAIANYLYDTFPPEGFTEGGGKNMKCGNGKCGEGMGQSAKGDMKCGDGGNTEKKGEMKCGEGKCGGN